MTERFLTTAEVAERFGVTIKTVNNWYHAGFFPHAIEGPKTGRGRTHLIPECDLVGFVPPQPGRPRDESPSEMALAKRRSRSRKGTDSETS